MKIVLVRPKYESHIITPPLGLGYLSSYLRKFGQDVKIIDALRDGLDQDTLVEKIINEKPDLVGITCLTAFYFEVVNLSTILKDKNLRVVIGGVHPTFAPYSTLVDSNADFVLCGEAERSLLKLIESNFDNTNIKGIYSLNDLKSEETPYEKGEIVENLDDLPFPDWEQLDPNKYPRAPHGAIVKHFPIGIVMTTRGCPYACTFCASPKFYGRRVRFRSPENVVAEIKLLVEKYGVKEIHFEDDNLTLKREHAVKICNLIIKEKLNISWACPNGIRADKIDDELIRLMKQSGCYYFSYGIESANSEILKNIRKDEKLSDIEKAIEIADRHGISCQGFFIFGLPGETKETIKESIDFAVRSKLSRAQFMILDIIPGSELWDKLNGKFTPNWHKESYREPEWIPEGLTKEDLQQAQSVAFKRFYLRWSRLYKLIRLIDRKQLGFLFQRLKAYRLFKK